MSTGIEQGVIELAAMRTDRVECRGVDDGAFGFVKHDAGRTIPGEGTHERNELTHPAGVRAENCTGEGIPDALLRRENYLGGEILVAQSEGPLREIRRECCNAHARRSTTMATP